MSEIWLKPYPPSGGLGLAVIVVLLREHATAGPGLSKKGGS